MGKIAFVFSGQGDQFSGMGKDLYEQYASARSVYDMCDSVRPDTSAQSFEGTEEELKETKNTQPCLFAFELAAASILTEAGVKPDATAGFSLGEVTAATFAGFFSDDTGFRLVCRRGELMQAASEMHDTSMAAVVKLSAEKVTEICKAFSEVYPVNFNCPGQITVSGLSSEMSAFASAVKEAGGRAIPLKVKGAFHSPFMKDAASSFADELSKADIDCCSIPLYSNMTAKPYGDDVAGLLSSQICNPVKWEELIRNMISDGFDTFIEIGPGKTLTNMIKKTDTDVKAYTFAEYLAEVCSC